MKHLLLKLKKTRTQTTSFIVGALTTSLLFFNNCGGPMGDTQSSTTTQTGSSTQQSTRAPSGSTANVPGLFLGSSSSASAAASSSTASSGSGASYGTAPTGVTSSIGSSTSSGSAATTASSLSLYSCSKGTSATDLTVSVSHSPNGPWVVGGQICKGQTGYFKVSGLPAGSIVKGCASPAASRDCFDISKHRDYLASERRSNGDIITVASAAETAAWPAGVYHFYNGAGNSSRMVIDFVGSASLVTCSGSSSSGSGSSSSAPVSCYWDVEVPMAVVGGGNNVPPAGLSCTTASHAGTRGTGYYDMGGGNRIAQGMICRCQ